MGKERGHKMENERYMRRGIDLKRMSLRFMANAWYAVAAILVGAALGVGIYLITHLIFASEQEYQSISKVYLNFDCEPKDFGELSYNGYTWNDLLDTDPILNYAMEALPAQVSREEVITATKAEILSDIRLLTVTVTTGHPELTAQIMEAVQTSLIHLGRTDELFYSIEIYSTTEPERIVFDNRTVNAAVMGAIITLFIVLTAMSMYYTLDDSVYVEADAEERFGLPVFGIFTEGEPGTFQSYGNEFMANYNYLCREIKRIALLSVDCEGDAQKAKQTMEKILSMGKLKYDHDNIPMGMPEDVPDVYDDIRRTDGVLLILRYGRGNGKPAERAINNLKKQNCRILGILIVEADAGFLKKYYMCKKQRSRK